MKRLLHILFISALSATVTCCSPSDSENTVPVRINRLDHVLSSGQMDEVAPMHRAAQALFDVTGRGELNSSSLKDYAQSQSTLYFSAAIDSFFTSADSISTALGRIYHRLEKQLPDAPRYDVYAIVLPYNQSVFFKDSMVFVGLNHYLGADFEAYNDFPRYLRTTKTPHFLPVDLTEAAIRIGYPFHSETAYPSLLNKILYEGAVVEALMQICGIDEKTALGYSYDQLSWLNENEKQAWEALITRRLLYSTVPSDLSAMINPAPATTLLNQEAPGRAGRFIGHRIVVSYIRNNPEVSLYFLLSPEFYMSGQSLAKAKYMP